MVSGVFFPCHRQKNKICQSNFFITETSQSLLNEQIAVHIIYTNIAQRLYVRSAVQKDLHNFNMAPRSSLK